MDSIYRELFSEMPYAAALENEYLTTRCATCFGDGVTVPCKANGCGNAFYCNDECRKMDERNHKYECMAFKRMEEGIDPFVRLLARILTRRLIDHGVLQENLCENFPENVRDRSLGDLLPHQTEIENCEYRSKDMVKSLQEFLEAYSNTPVMGDWKMVKRLYCAMWINCFAVSSGLEIVTSSVSLGVALYLNVSRFNHSCRPDLHVLFNGSRLIILYPSAAIDEPAITYERLALTRSSRKFNQLTINYGYSSSFGDSYFPLRRQRRESLKFAYYFKCQCVLCSDERGALLEEHAAPIECTKCHEPYVWKEIGRRPRLIRWLPNRKISIVCRKSCSCASDEEEVKSVKAYVKRVNPEENLKVLESEWEHAMSIRMEDEYAEMIIERCEPVWKKAKSFWHSSANLRLYQINERLFPSYYALIMQDRRENKTPDLHALKMAVETGEDSLAWLIRQNDKMNDIAMATTAFQLAQVYEASAEVAGTKNESSHAFKKASTCFSFAASLWRSYGQYAKNFVEKLMGESDRMERSVTAVSTETGEMETKEE